MKGKILSQKRKTRREIYDELLFDAMRYLAQPPPVLDDILPEMEAAFGELKELEALKRDTPANERTPEFESEYKKRMKACSKKLDVLTKRLDRSLNPPLEAEPTTRH
ncbi:MAG: hypothetical protein U1E67_01980 [Hyphomicrobiales bacterium]